LAFIGGLWGTSTRCLHRRFPRRRAYWAVAVPFGAVAPSLAPLLLVIPPKGGAIGDGWKPALPLTALLVDGGRGICTGLSLRWLPAAP
jgi:hypothetical protein